MDFGGGNRRTIVPRGAFTTGKQLTADFTEGKLHWCDREGMQVLRCNLDGSSLETLVVTGTGSDARDPRNWCVGIAVDPVQRVIYWTQKGAPKSGQGRICRAPIDIHLVPDGALMWTDRGAEPDGNTLNRASVKPTVANPQILSRDYNEAIGLATADDAAYYISDLGGSIRVVDIHAGTDRELVKLGPALTGIALAGLSSAAMSSGRVASLYR